MLFSQPELASFLNDSFECAWESLRPVPRVDIDFGGGVHLRRTLGGNVATWFCNARGEALDLVPGLVDAATFRSRAADALALHAAVRDAAGAPAPLLAAYHRARSLPPEAAPLPRPAPPRPAPRRARPATDAERLAGDTRYNRVHRFPAAHALLAEGPPAPPRALTARAFREILHVDLEDPWLGLAPYVLGGEGGRSVVAAD